MAHWREVRKIVARFRRLNPYQGRGTLDSILKIEDVNFSDDGKQQQLYMGGPSRPNDMPFTAGLRMVIFEL